MSDFDSTLGLPARVLLDSIVERQSQIEYGPAAKDLDTSLYNLGQANWAREEAREQLGSDGIYRLRALGFCSSVITQAARQAMRRRMENLKNESANARGNGEVVPKDGDTGGVQASGTAENAAKGGVGDDFGSDSVAEFTKLMDGMFPDDVIMDLT